MKLVFIDETSDAKFKDYFGICCAVIDHTKYRTIKSEFQRILVDGGWDPDIEFKGSYLFSASKGCPDVTVQERVDLAEEILKLNASDKYGRMKFAYLRMSTDDVKQEYLATLPALIDKVLSKPTSGQGKSLLSVYCDFRNDISCHEICSAIKPAVEKNGYTLVENVVSAESCFETVGVLYADLVAYLVARVDVITSDHELFDDLTPEMSEHSGKIKKLRSSSRLIEHIRNLNLYEVVDS